MSAFTVTTLADPGSGGAVSLRQAITSANAAGGANTIGFAGGLTGTIDLAAILPTITCNLTLSGPGASLLTVNGHGYGSVFSLGSSSSSTIAGLTIKGGAASAGGGICLNSCTLSLNNCVITGNSSTGAGGGLSLSGPGGLGGNLQVSNCTISGNTAASDGGGISGGYGAAIGVTNSVISGNTAANAGGGICGGYSGITATNSTISGNNARSGGGISAGNCGLSVTGCTISANKAQGSGNSTAGGIFTSNGTIRDTTITGNTATQAGGGVYNSGTLVLIGSTLNGNTAGAGGGLYDNTQGGTTVVNSTLTGNGATTQGGGIDNENGPLSITDSTIAGNSALTGGGGVYSYVTASNAGTINGTIVAANTGGDLKAKSGFFTGANDLIGDGSDQSALTNTQRGAAAAPLDPLLSPLGNFGGTTQTMALFAGSVAINNGAAFTVLDSQNNNITAKDQRGIARPQGAAPDIGAFEAETIAPGAATQLAFRQQPANSVAGSAIAPAIMVYILDSHGNLVTSDRSMVTLAVATGPAGAIAGGTPAVQALNGVATFSNVLVLTTTSGTVTLRATDGTLTAATSASFMVAPAPHLVFTQQPGNLTAGATSPAVKVAVEDTASNIIASNSSTVTLSIASGPVGGTLLGTAAQPAVSGVATFSNLSFSVPGNYTLSAAAGGLTSATSISFAVSPGAAAQMSFQQAFADTTAGTNVGPAITLHVQDAVGNLVTASSTVTLSILSGPAGATLSGTLTAPVTNGVATFGNVSFSKAGTYVVKANDGLLVITSNSFAISPAAASRVAFVQQPTAATAGQIISPPVTASVVDSFGNIITTDSSSIVTLSLQTAPPGAVLGGTVSAPAQNGVATFSNLMLQVAGSYKLAAADGSLGAATSASFAVIPGAASRVVVTASPSTVKAGDPLAAITAKVADAFGNAVTSHEGNLTVSIQSGPAGATLGGTTSLTVSGGVATFTNLVLTQAGDYTLAVTADGVADGALVQVHVNPAQASQVTITQPPDSVTAGQAIGSSIQVTVRDVYGNVITSSVDVTLSIVSGPAGGILGGTTTVTCQNGVATFIDISLTIAGAYTLQATGPGLAPSVLVSIDVAPAAPAQIVFATVPGSTTPGHAGEAQVVVHIADVFGNIVATDQSVVTLVVTGAAGGPVTLHATAHDGVAIFANLPLSGLGTYTLAASDGNLTPPTPATVGVVAPVASGIIYTQQPASAIAGAILTAVTVEVRDQFGNLLADGTKVTIAITGNPVGVTLGGTLTVTIHNGVATFLNLVLTKVGDYQLTVTVAGGAAATSTNISISPAAPARLAFVPQPPAATAGKTIPVIAVQVQDRFGNLAATPTKVSLKIQEGPAGAKLSGTTTITSTGGWARFTTLKLSKRGVYSLVASAPGLPAVRSHTFNVK